MSEMIERVAQALYTKRGGSSPWDVVVAHFPGVAEQYRELARTAIEAMTEPTEEMMEPCSDAWGDALGTTEWVWREMIEAALH